MSNPVVFFELTGPDAEQLLAFYGGLFGWTATARPFPGYAYVKAHGPPGAIREEKGAPAERLLYVGVADVDETLAAAVAAGAKVLVPVRTTPAGQRFALFEDPAGGRMGLLEQPEPETVG